MGQHSNTYLLLFSHPFLVESLLPSGPFADPWPPSADWSQPRTDPGVDVDE